MFCPQCGKEIKEGAKFCGECGWAVPAAPISVAPVVSAPVPQQEPPAPAADVPTARKSMRINALWFAAFALAGIIFEISVVITGLDYLQDRLALSFFVAMVYVMQASGVIMFILGIIISVLIIRTGKENTSVWHKAFPLAGLLLLLSFGLLAVAPNSDVFEISPLILILLWIAIAIILFIKERKNV